MKKIIAILLCASFLFSQNVTFAAVLFNNQKPNVEDLALENAQQDAFDKNYQSNIKLSGNALSPVEQLYNGSEAIQTGHVLKQVGYDLFSQQSTSSATGKFDNNYKLSIGEKVSVYLYGNSVDVMAISGSNLLSPVIKTEVDSKGNLFVQGLGVVNAENRTINEVESSLNRLASSKYSSLKVRLNIASGQEFSVFVYGHVGKPGKVMLGNNSSLLDALGAAGGIKKTGTLRNIVYTSGKKSRSIDLYKAIFAGNDENIIVRPNDKIFVGAIGNVVAIKNGVTVPGIYEAKNGESLQNIVSYAGRLMAGTQATEAVITSLDTKTQERTATNVAWNNAKNVKIKNGDTVEFKELYNEVENTVTIQGNIKHPATFAYKKGMRLSDILKSENELLEETFIHQAVIRRISGKDNTVETIPIFLKEFFAGANDPLLQPRDVINIYKNTNAQFVDVYGCISIPKHITYTENMRLDAVLTDIQFVESNIDDIDEYKETQNVSINEDNQAILEGGTSKNSKLLATENVAVEITSENGETQLYYLYDIMINSDRMKSIELKPNDKIFFRTLRSNEMLKKVKVSGFVNHPGVFNFVSGKRLTDMIEMAGGLTPEADLRGTVYKRATVQAKQIELARKNAERDIKLMEGRMASGYKSTGDDVKTKAQAIEALKEAREDIASQYNGQIALGIKENDITKIRPIDNIEVQDGDEIYIPRIAKHVSVIGEVYNEQSFMYQKGYNAKNYIKEVGGYTPNANKYRLYKVSVNGKAEKISGGSKIEPGDTIVIPRRIAGNDYITPVVQVLQGIASIAIAVLAIKR